MMILTTLLKPTSGHVFVGGYDVMLNAKKVREKIGYVQQEISVDEFLTGKENLYLHARINQIPRNLIKSRIDDVLELVELGEKKDEATLTYSGGMRKRLDIANGLLSRPSVLFLDEPTTGLDPGSRRVLWDEIKRLRDSGVTIILTTQYLEEADELADRISIIDQGLVVAEGSPDELKSLVGGDVITFSFTDEESVLKANSLIEDSEIENSELRVTVENGAKKIPPLFAMLSENNIEVVSVSASKPTLDDVFLQVTGYRLEGAEDETEENKEEVS